MKPQSGAYSILALSLLLLLGTARGATNLSPTPTPIGGQPQTNTSEEPAVRAVQKALPAVVNIATERIQRRQVMDPYDELFNQFFGGPMRRPREFSQTIQSLGSGVIVSAEGYIVTNEHVVERAADLKIKVTTSDGKVYDAKYISGDPTVDLAFIKITSPKPLPYFDLAEAPAGMLGQTVLALGNPLGYGHAVSRGIVSALDRAITVGEVEYKGLVQTDAAINPGNSGGALIDLNGKLLGINSVKMAFTPQGVPTQGIGFAIPAKTVRERVAEFMETARTGVDPKGKSAAERLYGLHLQDLTQDLAEAMGINSDQGVLVTDIDSGSPAAAAGIRRGLVIYRIGRYDISNVNDVEKLLQRAKPGTVADFQVGQIRRSNGQYIQQIQTLSVKAR
jgi:serine protease Do